MLAIAQPSVTRFASTVHDDGGNTRSTMQRGLAAAAFTEDTGHNRHFFPVIADRSGLWNLPDDQPSFTWALGSGSCCRRARNWSTSIRVRCGPHPPWPGKAAHLRRAGPGADGPNGVGILARRVHRFSTSRGQTSVRHDSLQEWNRGAFVGALRRNSSPPRLNAARLRARLLEGPASGSSAGPVRNRPRRGIARFAAAPRSAAVWGKNQ